jgi:ABC-type dipeptide/oligopeptide/nickel transport system ATPase component
MPQPILTIENLSVDSVSEQGSRRVLNEVTLSVEDGETVGVVGAAGSGKSVLTKAVIRNLGARGRIVGGSIVWAGRDLLKLNEEAMRALRGADIGFIESNPRSKLNPVQTIEAQLADVMGDHGVKDRHAARERSIEVFRAVGIPDPEHRLRAYPHELSGGMCQRVLIAMALVNRPRLLVADEPTEGLDVTIRLQILDLFRQLVEQHGAASLLVTRDLSVVAHYCDAVVVLQSGRVVERAPVREFFQNPLHPWSRALLRATEAATYGAGQAADDEAESDDLGSDLRLVSPGHYVAGGAGA